MAGFKEGRVAGSEEGVGHCGELVTIDKATGYSGCHIDEASGCNGVILMPMVVARAITTMHHFLAPKCSQAMILGTMMTSKCSPWTICLYVHLVQAWSIPWIARHS